jgi:hypothetical protein
MIHRSKLWFLTIVMMMFSELLYAQNTSGTITGRVTDTTGATISGARVSIINIGSGDKRDITTDASGNFTAALLLPDQRPGRGSRHRQGRPRSQIQVVISTRREG